MCVLRATTASSKSLRSCFRPETGASRRRANADALPGIASTRLDTHLAAGWNDFHNPRMNGVSTVARLVEIALLDTDAGVAAGFRNPCASSTRVGAPGDGPRLSCCHYTRLGACRRAAPRFFTKQVGALDHRIPLVVGTVPRLHAR